MSHSTDCRAGSQRKLLFPEGVRVHTLEMTLSTERWMWREDGVSDLIREILSHRESQGARKRVLLSTNLSIEEPGHKEQAVNAKAALWKAGIESRALGCVKNPLLDAGIRIPDPYSADDFAELECAAFLCNGRHENGRVEFKGGLTVSKSAAPKEFADIAGE